MEIGKNFAWPVTTVENDDRLVIENFLRHAKTDTQPTAIFGAGIRGSIFAELLKAEELDDFVFIDNNPDKWYGHINGKQIYPFNHLLKYPTKYRVLISTENSQPIVQQLEQNGFVKERNYFDGSTQEYPRLVDEFLRVPNPDLLVLGECGMSAVSLADKNCETLASMIKNELGESETKVLALHGMYARDYYHLLYEQLHVGARPQVVVVSVNTSTYTQHSHMLPHYQHPRLYKMLHQQLEDPSEVLKEQASITLERSQALLADLPKTGHEKDNARLLVKMNLMYKFKADTESARYLIKTLQLGQEYGLTVLPYITAVNYTMGARYYGDQFYEKHNQLLNDIKTLIRNNGGLEPLDMTYRLNGEQFAGDATWIEVANHQGRCIICDAITERVRSLL